MKRSVFLIIGLLTFLHAHAQDAQLKELAKSVTALRTAGKDVRNKAVLDLSAANRPKLTLMDEVRRDSCEYRGEGANQFKMNQVVTYVYNRQNAAMVTKGDFFNSTEKDIYYSAIEKTVKRGKTVTYAISGHAGNQEFIFVPFDKSTKYTATVNGKEATALADDGVKYLSLGRVEKDTPITFSIRLDASHPAPFESFVILNHNPQK